MVASTRDKARTKKVKPRDFPVRATPFCAIPAKVVNEMISAGANSGRQVGRSLCVVRVAGMNSAAWKIYEEWASSLGEQDPLVEVDVAPPDELRHTLLCPLHHLAPAMIQAFLQGVPAFIANLAPINIPLQPAAIRHGNVAVCAVPQVISNPGPNFLIIHSLHRDVYICDVVYTWRHNIVITSQVFRMQHQENL
ncbi:hypothetical protein LEN26_019560 [Aphanomyces euteiches]|nr:hypothetical protein LEN26_019560 [Aphanomyces euteiches]KAH9117172.1 hypothetical protein AeMF1_009007 [Aphanomyces euteiches]KAH9181769.1 hypothetical protein AeNC1_016255 [Aphanomyces euteiches]